jgi:hypothetical protein
MMKSTIAVDTQELSNEMNGSDLSNVSQDVDDSTAAF